LELMLAVTGFATNFTIETDGGHFVDAHGIAPRGAKSISVAFLGLISLVFPGYFSTAAEFAKTRLI